MNTAFVIQSGLLVLGSVLFIVLPLRSHARLVTARGEAPPAWRQAAAVLAISMAAAAAGLYLLLGNLDVWRQDPADNVVAVSGAQPPAQAASQVTQAQIEAMVARLAQRLQTQPDDADGWHMLARSYENLGRFDQAVLAYRKLLALRPDDPDLLTDFAVTLGMSKDQTLVGEPEQVIEQALRLKPDHVQALALSGSAAFEKHDYDKAIKQWRHLLSLVPPGDEVRTTIERNVAKAEALKKRDAQ